MSARRVRAVVAAALLAAAAPAYRAHAGDASLASADGRFVVAPKRSANGGGAASGAAYALVATLGQGEASGRLGGGSFEATLGVRARAQASLPAALFADGFE